VVARELFCDLPWWWTVSVTHQASNQPRTPAVELPWPKEHTQGHGTLPIRQLLLWDSRFHWLEPGGEMDAWELLMAVWWREGNSPFKVKKVRSFIVIMQFTHWTLYHGPPQLFANLSTCRSGSKSCFLASTNYNDSITEQIQHSMFLGAKPIVS